MARRGLRARLHELNKSASQHAADEIREQTKHVNSGPIGDVRERAIASVAGTARSVTLPPSSHLPLMKVELFDGDHSVDLVWLGRRTIAGIEPGVFLRASGRVACVHGQPTIYNPSYEILRRAR